MRTSPRYCFASHTVVLSPVNLMRTYLTRFAVTRPQCDRAFFNNTSQQDFGTRKVYCVSNVTFHAESKYAIKIFPSPTVFVQWPFK